MTTTTTTTTTISDIIYSTRGVLSTSDTNAIVLFKCDECGETNKHLTSFVSSPDTDTSYLCDGCIKK
jgi:hypothetical protein